MDHYSLQFRDRYVGKPMKLIFELPFRRLVLLNVFFAGCGNVTDPELKTAQHAPLSAATTATSLPADSQLLRGVWEIVKCDRNGEVFPQEVGGRISFDGDKAVSPSADGTKIQYLVELNSSVRTKTIDWQWKQDNQTQTLRGLYAIDGRTLHTCSPSTFEADRPSEIRTVAGDGRWVFQLEKISDFVQP